MITAVVVGCGGLGTRHAKNAQSLEGIELVAVCDAFADTAQKLANELPGKTEPYSDYQKMLSVQKPNAVIVVTPNHVHGPISVHAAQSGAHVFCEKPMALTLEDCDAMLHAAEQSNVFLQIGYIRRFQNAYREMKRLVDAGKIGDVHLAFAVRLGAGPPGGAEGWQRARNKYGGLYSMHSHELDMLTWMAGEVAAVSAIIRYDDDSEDAVEESILINLEFSSGAIGSISSSRIYPVNAYEFGIAGSEGSLKLINASQLAFQRQGCEREIYEYERNDGFVEELQHFFTSIRTQTPPDCNGLDGRRTIEISLAALKAARTGRRVSLHNKTHDSPILSCR